MATKRSEIGGARVLPQPKIPAPRQTTRVRKGVVPQASSSPLSSSCSPAAEIHEIPEANPHSLPVYRAPPETPLGGQVDVGNQLSHAAQNPSGTAGAEEGHLTIDAQRSAALLGEINAVVRRYNDLRRAHQRLLLQAMSVCRIVCDGDKKAAAKLYKNPSPEIGVWLMPYEASMEPLTTAIAEHEKLLEKLGKKLPVADWAKGVSGLSFRFLALIVGECGIGPGEYRTVSALWKRMGMAVIDGKRQRRVTGDAAIEQGYVARRRALMWNIGESILKQQVRNPKDADGKPLGEPQANGPFGEVYLARKAYMTERNEAGLYADRAAKAVEQARRNGSKPHLLNLEGKLTPSHIHNDAKRYMEKRLLRELWKAWRAA